MANLRISILRGNHFIMHSAWIGFTWDPVSVLILMIRPFAIPVIAGHHQSPLIIKLTSSD